MEITLRNGEKLTLDWNPIVLEYLEDYDGGIKKLQEDIGDEQHRFRTFNFIIYCIVSANYPHELEYREAISLVKIDDLDKIIQWTISNFNNINIKPEPKEKIKIYKPKHRIK